MEPQMTETHWPNLHGVSLFLSCFRKPATLQKVAGALDWQPLLGCTPERAAEQLIASGVLENVEPADLDVPLLRCTKRGEIWSEVYLEIGARSLPQQADLPRHSWSEAIMWLITAIGGGILGNAAYETLTALVPELLRRAGLASPEEVTRLRFEPETVLIPAGPFLMGTTDRQVRFMRQRIDSPKPLSFGDEQPAREVILLSYRIGRYPVTNSQYAAFVDDGGYRNPAHWTEAGWKSKEHHGWTQPRFWDDEWFNAPSQPVVGVFWYEALAYCKWLAAKTRRPYRLPTEAEWEKAARGTDRRLWPWGNQLPDPGRCNFHGNVGRPTPVGKYSPAGDSPYGCGDMAGNIWEWCQSLYAPYPYHAGDGREDLEAEGSPVRRGGSWLSYARNVRCACRGRLGPVGGNDLIGCRVARGHLG